MDEPTAGVDAASQHVLADVLSRLAAQHVPMVIVTHEMGPLERLLSRIVVVDQGRVCFDGTPAAYAASRDEVHHEHDSHHHDLELDVADDALPRGPFDTPGGRRA
jgi:zinc transport system ATP-binding protein